MSGSTSIDRPVVRRFLALDHPPPHVKEYERKQLLARLDREGATVGFEIPDEIEVQGEPVELREFVLETTSRETVPPGERDRVERAKRNLRRERTDRVDLIEAGEISREEGERHVDAVVGIDRALNALDDLGPTDLETEMEARETADRKRWVSFLNQALGRDDDAARRPGR